MSFFPGLNCSKRRQDILGFITKLQNNVDSNNWDELCRQTYYLEFTFVPFSQETCTATVAWGIFWKIFQSS